MNNNSVSLQACLVRACIHDGVLTSTLMYGSESWVWQKKNERRINAVEMRSLRSAEDPARRLQTRAQVYPVPHKIDGCQSTKAKFVFDIKLPNWKRLNQFCATLTDITLGRLVVGGMQDRTGLEELGWCDKDPRRLGPAGKRHPDYMTSPTLAACEVSGLRA
ncbi:hypothetical protein EVAR_69556_1 [Eumeta japonica]|uniref:Uncharacterized protein n=1 Tax=Eumeta variegata TaxID=151549 RepID=A0A4C1ZZG4_EUMVA|nr:hypothetical protein EVAR_69556_1 [Eumeta japonica]